jgi:hypothetical protein
MWTHMNTDTIGNHVATHERGRNRQSCGHTLTRTQFAIMWTHMNTDTIGNHVDTHEHGHNRQSCGNT